MTSGLWNDPDVLVHAFVNGTDAGTFLVHDGYFFPGPSTNSFDVTGLLVEGVNTIRFDDLGASPGEYVIGSVELQYNLPMPVTNNVPDVTNSVPLPGGPIRVLHWMTHNALTPVEGSQVAGRVRMQSSQLSVITTEVGFHGRWPSAANGVFPERGDGRAN